MGVKLKGISDVDGSTVEINTDDFKGGGGGGVTVVKFDFSFNTPGLAQGIDIYTPEVGDVLYNLWFDVRTPFDGTTPKADAAVAALTYGLVGSVSAAYNLAGSPGETNGIANDNRSGQASLIGLAGTNRIAPGRFITTDPLKLFANQDGKCDGTGLPLDSTVGEASIFAIVIPAS